MPARMGLRSCVLLGATALAGTLAAPPPAAAQSASQLQSIQQQITQLQAQLRRLQREVATRDRALRQAQDDAAQARAQSTQAMQRASIQPVPAPPSFAPSPATPFAQGPSQMSGSQFSLGTPNPKGTSLQGASPASITTTAVDRINPTFRLGGITVTLGGFIDTTALYRSRDLTAGTSTNFNAIPFSNAENAHLDEFRLTAQPSRFSLLMHGEPDRQIKLEGYVEFDLNAAAVSANSTQTSSYTPRVRLAYATYDNTAYGWHLLAGQDWTLATGNLTGITPRKESIPPTIDANYNPGFVYLRQPQIRVVKDFGGKLWLGASLEAPQETYTFAGATASTSTPNLTLPDGNALTFNSLGGTYLNSTASYSYDTAPDMIVKAAVNTGIGHYEAYGLGRFFKARTATLGAGDTRTVFGGGVGGSAVIPIVPKLVELSGNVLGGYGVGRYGASQLPDATFKSNGAPAPLGEIIAMAGVVAHPVPPVDLYAFAGTEQVGRSDFTSGSGSKLTGYGYGTPLVSNAGCEIELGSCGAQTRAIDGITAGAWWRFLHGDYGTVEAGVEYSYIKRIAFVAKGGRPTTDADILFFTLRFLPFQ